MKDMKDMKDSLDEAERNAARANDLSRKLISENVALLERIAELERQLEEARKS